jgi:hypothetical protein
MMFTACSGKVGTPFAICIGKKRLQSLQAYPISKTNNKT